MHVKQQFLQKPRYGNNPNAHQQRTVLRRCERNTHTMEHYSPIMKKYCHLLDGPREYHTQSEKDKYHITYIWNLKELFILFYIQNK